MRIFLDPGHGGTDSGAIGPSGVPEKDIALAVTLQLAGHLYSLDHIVEYSRRVDLYPTLDDRCDMANDWGAHAFVSIHCNAFNNPAAHGYEVWTNPEADPADYLAGLMWYRFREQFPDMRGRADFSDDDPDKESHFYVLTHTSMPAVLFELAFITNPQDEARLLSPAWQARASLALANAIKEWAS